MEKRILIVEDNKTLANLMAKQISTALDIEVDLAYRLSEAKLFLQRYSYLVVLSDLNLPDAPDGEIVDYALARQEKVIVLTANIDKNFRKSMMKKNIIDYVKKSGVQDIKYIISMLKRLEANEKHTVLIVDDSMTMRSQLKNLLENLMFKVITVAHGEEALMMLHSNPAISLVLTDYNMPVMDGMELTLKIREEFDKNALSIIALSSSEDEEIVAQFLKNGANDYIKKPFSKEEFYCRINNTIEALENLQKILNNANRDFLTGLYNRRYFFDHITNLESNAKESFEDLYLAMIDIDNFKSINDTYGHDDGDKAIVGLSEILRSNTHQEDLVARFGGEEFCIAYLSQDDNIAIEILERIRKNVENFRFQTQSGLEVGFTVSIGLTKHADEAEINDTINESDLNLYKAKENGKNQIIFA